ncbi:MAG TPA: proton-conducting transporter membrane subunit, partial [Candidatus Lustribacter sp.]|nr:proton-conducting transporter membrane subunit [Candidatus Lustribacter sp.]
PTVPQGFASVASVLAGVGVVGIIWGGLACLVERDLKRLIAYSSVAHMGFVALALASGTETGVQAALFANIAHGIVSALLFFLVGALKDRWLTADLDTLPGALRETSPRFGFAFVVGFAGALGLPGLVGFWGEFLAVYAAWNPMSGRPVGFFQACAVVAVIGMTIAASYSLRVLRVIWAGESTEPGRGDARGLEWAVVATLIVAVIGAGVLPRPLLAVTAADVTTLVSGSTAAAAGGTAAKATP